MDECFVSVDIEASGPVPGLFSMLALGACVADDRARRFYVELKPTTNQMDPSAMRVSRLSLADLALRGEDPSRAVAMFADWVQQESAGRRPVFVGFNAAFDWAFVNWYFHAYGTPNPFGFAPLDIKSFFMGLTGCAWADTSSSRLPDEFQPAHPQTHNALDDAIAQAEIFEHMLARARAE